MEAGQDGGFSTKKQDLRPPLYRNKGVEHKVNVNNLNISSIWGENKVVLLQLKYVVLQK